MVKHDGFGIVAESLNQRVSIFDTETLEVIQQIPLGADAVDVAITGGCRFAVVSSLNSRTMFQLCLNAGHARVTGSAISETLLRDIALTPDGCYAICVDGAAAGQDIVSYSLVKNEFVSSLPTSAQAVAVSPVTGKLVLTGEYFSDSVHRFTVDSGGSLVDTGQSFPAGQNPNNLNFSPDGRFAFVANYSGGVSVLSTLVPDNVLLLGTAPASGLTQCLAVSRDGRYVFALTARNVDVYSFSPIAGSLTLLRSFAHGLTATAYFGIERLALDASGTRLFISHDLGLAVFTTYGLPLGSVAGITDGRGVDICLTQSEPCDD
jgi:DNA-binding beta-propeller fold protein YncE